MFPFGFGLSYTQFGIGHLHLDRDCMNVDGEGDDLSHREGEEHRQMRGKRSYSFISRRKNRHW